MARTAYEKERKKLFEEFKLLGAPIKITAHVYERMVERLGSGSINEIVDKIANDIIKAYYVLVEKARKNEWASMNLVYRGEQYTFVLKYDRGVFLVTLYKNDSKIKKNKRDQKQTKAEGGKM